MDVLIFQFISFFVPKKKIPLMCAIQFNINYNKWIKNNCCLHLTPENDFDTILTSNDETCIKSIKDTVK